jgi:hypothetical protein
VVGVAHSGAGSGQLTSPHGSAEPAASPPVTAAASGGVWFEELPQPTIASAKRNRMMTTRGSRSTWTE